MFLIPLLVGMIFFIISISYFDLIKGLDKSSYKLKKHIMAFNGIQPMEKSIHKKLHILKRYSLIYKIILVPAIIILVFIISLLIIKNIYIFIFLCIAGVMFFVENKRNNAKKRKENISFGMRDFMISVTNSLRAGASFQSAIEKSVADLKRLPIKKNDNPLLEEIEKVVLDMNIGRSMDEALIAFKNRVDTEETDIFVNMSLKLKETGGDIIEIITMVSNMINERILFKREIMTLTAGKRYESRILTIVPIALLLMLSLTAPDYIAPLFDTSTGRIMTLIGLILILLNYYIGQRIVDINI